MARLNPLLEEILACPKCKGPLDLEEEDRILCRACGLAFPIRDGLPVMLVDEAEPLE